MDGMTLFSMFQDRSVYRHMEKLSNINGPTTVSGRLTELPFVDSLQVPFAPLKLLRPLSHFGTAVGLRPGIAKPPDPDFLVHIVEGGSHQEQLRKAFGNQFKNLEHFLRGAHEPTATTLALLLLVTQTDEATLRSFSHGSPDGPLLPAYVALFRVLEGVFLRSYRAATIGTVKCPCCGGDVLDDAHVWWNAQAVVLSQDAYGFDDRLLQAMLGSILLSEALCRRNASDHFDTASLLKLASPERHPVGNWMELVKLSRGLKHDWELTVGLDADPRAHGSIPDGRLRKWRSGQNLLPLDKAFSMVATTKHETTLKHAIFAARTLSLAIDVVQAAAETPSRPTRKLVQEMISARLRQLHLHFQIGKAAATSANTSPSTRSPWS